MSVQCLYHVCTVTVLRLSVTVQMSVWCLHSVCTLSAQCLRSVCVVFVQCLYSVCTVFVQCLPAQWLSDVSEMSVQCLCLYSICTMIVQRLYSDCTMSAHSLYSFCKMQNLVKENLKTMDSPDNAHIKAKTKFKGRFHCVAFLIWFSTFSSEPQRDAL